VSDERSPIPSGEADEASSPPSLPPAALVEALHERYEIIRETGRGASATVYLARDLKHERLVALKTLNAGVGPRAGERFLREIQVAAGMQHPHILPMYDSGIADGRLYFVMPFVDGGSLRDRLDADTQLSVADALRCTHDVALALAFAHDQGIVHRDIKPDNILFYHGHACLADFGVARVIQQLDIRLTAQGMIVGTPAYMSPEQLTDTDFDGRSDVYSLACVLYEMLCGVHAFAGFTPQELLRKRLRQTPEPVRAYRTDVPQAVENLLARALAASPGARFPHARAFAEAVEAALLELANPPRQSASGRLFSAVPHPLAWAGSIALLLALVALGAAPLRTVFRSRAGNTLEAATRSARDSYLAGKSAFDKWDLPAAERELSHAANADPHLIPAQLRLAQTLELSHRSQSEAFRIAATRLASARASLHGRDSLYAEALIALADKSYQQACGSFERLRSTDSLDALAWYGLGDCLALDSAVVPDAKSPSGWSFRTSWPGAARAYMRSAAVDPSAHRALPYALLTALLPTDPSYIRMGRTTTAPVQWFAAYPALIADTVAYVPYPLALLMAVDRRTISSTLPDVLQRNRTVLADFANEWTTAQPDNADAFEALALAREARGQISAGDDGADFGLRRARELSAAPEQQLRLAAFAVRLHVKRGDFDRARVLSDSLLGAWDRRTASPGMAQRLAGLAALTGRVGLTARYAESAARDRNARAGIAPPLTAAWSLLFARAALGVCDDSLVTLVHDIDRLLESYTQPSGRDAVRRDLLGRPGMLAFPCAARELDVGPSIVPLARAQAAASNVRQARLLLDSTLARRAGYRPGDVSLDYTVQEAALRAAIGDTSSAIRQLDLVLNALPTLGTFAVREEAQAAALGRALALRAELAARAGDKPTAVQRARQALTLWQDADPPVATRLGRLREIAGAGR
jgi:hypothetical protein